MDKTLKREPIDVKTKGTFMGEESQGAVHLMALKVYMNEIGFAILES